MSRRGGQHVALCPSGERFIDPQPDCPNAAEHTPEPPGYMAWHQWAAGMAVTHTQRLCTGCGRYRIWAPRRGIDTAEAQEALYRHWLSTEGST